ncbi:MAG: FAD-dependent oxidoreductase, partial [Actinobacteria bacterium]|nr:FAD-dependent oxidoreductase [Actinomycetota bacterium]
MNLISNDTNKTNKKFNYIIIGNSAAGLSAVESIRKADEAGSILVLSYENYLNYSKPLITYYIANKVDLDNIYFKSKEFYDSRDIFVKLGVEVTKIDTEKKSIITKNHDKFYFDRLLIASGGKPIIPKINIRKDNGTNFYLDSINYKEIKGVFTLTTLDDAIKIKKYIFDNSINHVSILGGGLIGLKAAEAFLDIGLQIDIIELSERILSATFDTEASTIIEDRIRKENSNIFTYNTVEEIVVSNNKIKSLRLRDGKEI